MHLDPSRSIRLTTLTVAWYATPLLQLDHAYAHRGMQARKMRYCRRPAGAGHGGSMDDNREPRPYAPEQSAGLDTYGPNARASAPRREHAAAAGGAVPVVKK